MRKEAGLFLAGLVAFDLGTVVVPAQAADTSYLKIDRMSATSDYLKIDNLKSADACVASKGTPVEFNGAKYCQTPKSAAGAAKAIPSNQRK